MRKKEHQTANDADGTFWLETCRWVPGTLDRVRVGGEPEITLSLEQFRAVAGGEAVNALYLRGQVAFRCDAALWSTVAALAKGSKRCSRP